MSAEGPAFVRAMIRRARRYLLAALLVAAGPDDVAARVRPAPVAADTVLIGQSWLGLWRDGRVVRAHVLDGWQLGAARLSPDRRTVEIAAYRTDAAIRGDTLLRFDAHVGPARPG